MSEPLLFISHKHSDQQIAEVLADFIAERSNNKIQIHLSCNPEFQGPKYGQNLNAQLRNSLWHTDVLLLVYTDADQDWSYCMWECGVATHPNSQNTNMVVFQCGRDVPAPFQDVLRVNVHEFADVKRFTKQLFRDEGFFPSLQSALAPGFKEEFVHNAATALHESLKRVVPRVGGVEEWSAWPALKVELPWAEVDDIEQASEAERLALANRAIREHAVIVEGDVRTAQIFGRAAFSKRTPFYNLVRYWLEKYPDAEPAWFDSCCEQIATGAKQGFPVIRWTPIREVGGDTEFTPVLSRIRRSPFTGSVQFDLYFYDLADPRAIPVERQMIPIGKFYYKLLGEITPEDVKLMDLVQELEDRGLNRVPILTAEEHPLYIIHRSMIEKHIVASLKAPLPGKGPQDLTLADLLAHQGMRDLFENGFVAVKKNATLAEAKSAMVARPGCSDVFVTTGGTRTESVVGWLTNVDIVRGT
ncbi:hypothetical protein [Longimicrobium sp.]|uniref:hypothetical protein n=1 Tax=Longimicrobium sp. TaxID=2029185 RepID=UPI003B3B158F